MTRTYILDINRKDKGSAIALLVAFIIVGVIRQFLIPEWMDLWKFIFGILAIIIGLLAIPKIFAFSKVKE